MSRYYVRKGIHYGTADDMIDYIDNLEAKLVQVVEECARIAQSHKPSADLLSDRYWRGVDEAAHSIAAEIYTTLAELKGDPDA